MTNKDLGLVSEEELSTWDSYAAAALSGALGRESMSPNNAAKKAADAADALLIQRRSRQDQAD
jgi:hypothetical protein